jgi:hypothetical protein
LSEVAGFGEGLSGNQGIIAIYDSSMEAEKVEEVVPEVIIPEEEIIPEKKEEELEPTGEWKEKVGKAKELSSEGISKLGNVLGVVVDKSGEYWTKFTTWLGNFTNDKFGRKQWYKKIASKLSMINIGGREGVKGMKVGGYKDKAVRNRRLAILGVVIVIGITLLLGIQFTQQAKEAAEVHNQVLQAIDITNGYIEDAESTLQSDRTAAETAIFNADAELDKLDNLEVTDDDQLLLDEVRGKLDTLDDKINRRVALNEKDKNIEAYLDTRLTFGDGSAPTDIAIFKDSFLNEHIYVVDSGLAEVYKITLFDKGVGRIPDTGDILSKPTFIDVGTTGLYVYDEANGVVKSPFNDDGDSLDFQKLSGLDRSDVDATEVVEMAIFTSTDNVYLLSRDMQSVLKSNNSGGYGLLYNYMSGSSFATSTDLFGDFSIYVLTEESGLERHTYSYTEGQVVESPVSVTNVSPTGMTLSAGYTGETTDYKLYAFDSANRRILVFEKPVEGGESPLHPNEMVMVKQYVYRGERSSAWENVKDIVVDDSEGFIYILDGNTVWKVNLNS